MDSGWYFLNVSTGDIIVYSKGTHSVVSVEYILALSPTLMGLQS